MDYEKAYKKAVEKLRYKISDNDGNIDYNEVVNVDELQDIFHELAETEDKRIRKALIRFFGTFPHERLENSGVSAKEAIAWLEKQVKLNVETTFQVWKDMRLEVFAQASGNRHESNCSDECTKMFSLCDIDEIILNITEKQGEKKSAW